MRLIAISAFLGVPNRPITVQRGCTAEEWGQMAMRTRTGHPHAFHDYKGRGGRTVAERNALKPRKCDFCSEDIITDAKGIKKHAVACEKELEEKTTPHE